jgi:hypothetical protein
MPSRRAAMILGVVALAMTGCQAGSTDGSPVARRAESSGVPVSSATSATHRVPVATTPHTRSTAGTEVLTSRPPAGLPPATKSATPPAVPHGAPPFPGDVQQPVGNTNGPVRHRTFHSCPPRAARDYEKDCANTTYGGRTFGTYSSLRWGNEPYFHTHMRYVWIVDELPTGSRESAWLQLATAAFNKAADSSSKPPRADRPHFIYLTAQQARAKTGSNWAKCSKDPKKRRQIVEVCLYDAHNPAHRKSTDSFFEADLDEVHLLGGYVAIKLESPDTDQGIEYDVVHEFGHVVGFTHDTDCRSVMSSCLTYEQQKSTYLWYGPNDLAAYSFLYDKHPRN